MIHILIHRCSKKDMYEAYDELMYKLLEVWPSSSIKYDGPAAIIWVIGLMRLDFRSGHDLIKLKGLRPDYINADSYIASDEMYYRCTQDNPVIDDIYEFIDHFIEKHNRDSEQNDIFRYINQVAKSHMKNTGSSKFKFVCNEAIEPYAREFFKNSDVEIIVAKTYEEEN